MVITKEMVYSSDMQTLGTKALDLNESNYVHKFIVLYYFIYLLLQVPLMLFTWAILCISFYKYLLIGVS